MASLADPTVELVSQAIGTEADYLIERLADAEAKGIISVDGNRLRFSHPLLAAGVYTDATPAQRRRPLLDLAIRLGGDTDERQMRLAADYFGSGDNGRARAVLQEAINRMPPGPLRAHASSLLDRVVLYDDGFIQAARLLEQALGEVADDLPQRVQLLVTLSYALSNAGQPEAGIRTVDDAVRNAEELGRPDLLSLALGMRVVYRFMRGDGVDEHSLERALELEDR